MYDTADFEEAIREAQNWTHEELLEAYQSLLEDNMKLERELDQKQQFLDWERNDYESLKKGIKENIERRKQEKKHLEKLISELETRHDKHSLRRLLLTWGILSAIFLFLLCGPLLHGPPSTSDIITVIHFLIISPTMGGAVLFLVYGISSCTFIKNCTEAFRIIELHGRLQCYDLENTFDSHLFN